MSPTSPPPNLYLARRSRIAILASAACAAFISTAASADCTVTTGTSVQCSGASTGYVNFGDSVSLSADTTASITGPVLLGNDATVINAGQISSSTAAPILQVGTNSSILNDGSIQLSPTTSGSAAVVLGDDSTLTNNGSLGTTAGFSLLQFGQAGTFINNSAATAAVTGNILFGPNVSGGVSTLKNYNTAFGIDGNVYSTGNTDLYNDGLFNGSLVQTATGGTVTLTNDSAGNFTGFISTGDATTIANNGIMAITGATNIGSARLGPSSFTNAGTLSVGTTAPIEFVVNGAFVNGPSGILNIALHSNGIAAPVAGTSYSQIYAAGPNGTATLGGTLNLVATPGFYPSGSIYNLVLADQGITGNFASVNGTSLPFISFVPVGIVNLGSQVAYEVEAVRSGTYAQAIASVATPAEIAIATGLQPMVATANADPTGTAAALIGDLDLLTIPQMQTLLDQINPANYFAFAGEMSDQVNIFDRQVILRTMDGPRDQPRSGGWIDGSAQFEVGSSDDGLRQRMSGVTAGYDLGGRHWLVGAAAGFSSATLRSDTATFAGHNHAYILGAYGSLDLGPLTATGQLDYDLGSLSATKQLSLTYQSTTTAATTTTPATTTTTAVNTPVTASPGDHLFKATGTIGADLKFVGMKATPFIGIDVERGAINGFTEAGGGAADLTVADVKINRTDMLAGLYVTASSGSVRPYVRAAYRSQLGGGSGDTVSAYFNGDPTTTFAVTGSEADRHELDLDGGIDVPMDDATFFLGYQETARKELTEAGFHVGIRIPF